MDRWKELLQLEWLTAEDGRVSYSKLVQVVLMSMLGVLIWHIVDSPDLVDSLWPLVWLFALLLAGSYGLKGLSLWFKAARLRTSGGSLRRERDPARGVDPS